MTTNKSNAGLVKREETAKTIIKGIKSAQREYEKMSKCWLDHGAEYLITVSVARTLWEKFGDGTVMVEGSSDEMRKDAGAKKGRPPKSVKGKRYDIVLYFKNGDPRAVIEIKGWQNYKQLLWNDVERIMNALKTSKVRFGALGYYFSAEDGDPKSANSTTAEEKLHEYAETLFKGVKKMSRDDKKTWKVREVKSTTYRDEEYAWLAGCITIERGVGNTIK